MPSIYSSVEKGDLYKELHKRTVQLVSGLKDQIPNLPDSDKKKKVSEIMSAARKCANDILAMRGAAISNTLYQEARKHFETKGKEAGHLIHFQKKIDKEDNGGMKDYKKRSTGIRPGRKAARISSQSFAILPWLTTNRETPPVT